MALVPSQPFPHTPQTDNSTHLKWIEENMIYLKLVGKGIPQVKVKFYFFPHTKGAKPYARHSLCADRFGSHLI
jgi:hypothetical protein